jgi:hypothetical protein
MSNVLEWFHTVDFSASGQKILSLIDGSDPCFIGFVLILMILLGSKMSAPYPMLRAWGLRAALAAFLSYVGYVWFTAGIGDDWVEVLSRGALAAGFVLAPLWIIFPVLLFVYGRLRLALAALLVYAGYAWLANDGPITEDDLPGIALRAGVAAGVAILVAWIVQPITDFIGKNLFPNLKPKEPAPAPAPEKHLPVPVPVNPPQRTVLPEELLTFFRQSRTIPGRDRQEEADRQRRRQQARMKVELCYALHEPLLAVTLPRPKFEEFVNRYLSDEFEPEIVESCAQYLEAMLFQQASNAQPLMVQPVSLPDLTQWLVEEQQKIEKQEPDPDRKKTRLAGLTRRYTQLAEKILEEEPAR